MDTVSKILLGLIAISSLVQALVVLVLALAGRQLFRELKALRDQVGELATVMGDVGRTARNGSEISESVDETTDYLGRAARRGVLPLVELGALWQGAKRAVRVYREHRGPPDELGGPHEIWAERQADASDR